ncbi:patatin-like phospholipase family protein [Asticcacaulis sp. ZE23SCel15]|uniref:patatin-like phospholipase family protein n=1 Tax=Asticcacaulis sp. ZE23SCel15 TaxID=3059027 RepID=UPI00265E2961|nr:patatin-like phospholipase family protein [Asticcacaulis sp. ZE23SCel15]WKL58928.1 patatin-like phospholipase family protein [Asticcacaulis sp. ZE23SCel15]
MKMDAIEKLSAHYEQVVLVLQGGGALGSYQAGAYQVLHAHGIEPNWIAGVSIGAINAAIIAGNAPDERMAKLTSFWEQISTAFPTDGLSNLNPWFNTQFRQMSGLWSMFQGVPGFFRPSAQTMFSTPWLLPSETSFYDVSPLRDTLLSHIDFKRLNDGDIRLSLGAVHVTSGNFVYFDNRERTITPEHIMASGALPPGFPAVMIDGEAYWDGGVVSNTPLSYVLHGGVGDMHEDTLVFQIDLFNAQGAMPETLDEVYARIKDITYSSRTRLNTDAFLQKYVLRQAIRTLYEHIPDDAKDCAEVQALKALASEDRVTIVHLIHRGTQCQTQSKDYEFSRVTMLENWASGVADAQTAMRHEEWRTPPTEKDGLMVYDFTRGAKRKAKSGKAVKAEV